MKLIQRKHVTGLHLLKPLAVKNAQRDSNDGGGLWLRIRGDKATWIYRYTTHGKRRDLALGVCYRGNETQAGQSLTNAREAAAKAREAIASGIDPVEQKKAQKAATRATEAAIKIERQRDHRTLARVAREYHERVIEPNRSTKHGLQWLASLENHVPASLWHKPVADVGAVELLDTVAELQARIPETASRVRQRLEAIFDDAEFRGYRTGNPARAIRRKLRELTSRRSRGRFRALPYEEAPAFMRALRLQEGIGTRMLEFAALTAARTGEVLGAVPDEFKNGVWTIPAERMKGGDAHTVFLPLRAIAILNKMLELGGAYVFPSPMDLGRPCSNMAMLAVLRRMGLDDRTTVHGFCRATFSTWAHETNAARPDVIEAALAHQEGDRVKAAYNRAQFNAERKALLAAWADFLDGKASNEVEFSSQRIAA